jgi:hypothetical protein
VAAAHMLPRRGSVVHLRQSICLAEVLLCAWAKWWAVKVLLLTCICLKKFVQGMCATAGVSLLVGNTVCSLPAEPWPCLFDARSCGRKNVCGPSDDLS